MKQLVEVEWAEFEKAWRSANVRVIEENEWTKTLQDILQEVGDELDIQLDEAFGWEKTADLVATFPFPQTLRLRERPLLELSRSYENADGFPVWSKLPEGPRLRLLGDLRAFFSGNSSRQGVPGYGSDYSFQKRPGDAFFHGDLRHDPDGGFLMRLHVKLIQPPDEPRRNLLAGSLLQDHPDSGFLIARFEFRVTAEQALDPEIGLQSWLTLTAPNVPTDVFAQLEPVWDEIQAMPIDTAHGHLVTRVAKSRSELSLFGVATVNRTAVSLGGPLLVAVILGFIGTHLSEARRRALQTSSLPIRSFAWIGLHHDRVGTTLTWMSLSALPIACSIGLVAVLKDDMLLAGLAGAFVSAVGATAWVPLNRLRRSCSPPP